MAQDKNNPLIEERYRSFLEAMPSATLVTDVHDVILMTNAELRRTFGYKLHELPGQKFEVLIPGKDRIDDNFWSRARKVETATEQKEATVRVEVEVEGLRRDGTVFPMQVKYIAYDANSIPLKLYTLTDLTEVKEIEKRLRHSQKMEAVGRLAGGIAHDFNNLLMVMQGSAEIMLMGGVTLERGCHDIIAAVERGSQIIKQLLTFSRQKETVASSIDVNDVLGEVEKMLSRLLPDNIEFKVVKGTPIKPVRCDPTLLFQAIMNLSTNARDAMFGRHGKITIDSEVVVLDEFYVQKHRDVIPGRYVMVAVTDTGTGMLPEVQEKMFNPYFTTKEAHGGTGLGLAIVQSVAKDAGGHVNVYSEVGVGTTVKMYFPTINGSEQSEKPEIIGTVLVVEDEESLREITMQVLSGNGYHVLEARGGKQGFELMLRHHEEIDVVIADLVMPEMGGLEMVTKMRQSDPKLGIIVLSGYSEDDDTAKQIDTLGGIFLRKPFPYRELLHRVEMMVIGRKAA